MYATYIYGAGATQANILADIILLLTGTTDVNSLSDACIKASSSITAAVNVAGWSVYDASAGTNAQCLRAAVADNASQYKYIVLDANTAGCLKCKVYEGWNSSTHVGTNLAYYSDSTTYSQPLNTTLGGRLDVAASARYVLFMALQNSTFGVGGVIKSSSGILERTRRSAWDTVAAGYPPFIFAGNFNGILTECRRKDSNQGEELSSSTPLSLSTPVNADTWLSQSICGDAAGNPKHVLFPMGCYCVSKGHLGGDLSSLCDIWMTTTGLSPFDILTVDMNTKYVVWPLNNTTRMAVRRG